MYKLSGTDEPREPRGPRRWALLTEMLLPSSCVACADIGAGGALCRACVGEFARAAKACAQCALPIAHNTEKCLVCRTRPPAFDGAVAGFLFEPPMSTLIHKFKFGGALAVGRALGVALGDRLHAQLIASQFTLPEVLVPVPLHSTRLRERGFNQATVLAKPLARELRLDLELRVARRVGAAVAQSTLQSREARGRNIRGAFLINSNALAGARVAIVDDVLTSGATANELAAVLTDAGAASVQVWALARAV
ncbi:MAG: ComF family protein [Gammaproteobacteria bacterium]